MHYTKELKKKSRNPNVNNVSDRLGDLIDNGVTERVYKNTVKKGSLKNLKI